MAWADLPTEMVDAMVSHLDIFSAARLTTVCTSWAKSVTTNPFLPFGKPCLIMTHQDEAEEHLEFDREAQECMFDVHDLSCSRNTPVLAFVGGLLGRRWVGANGEWLATVDYDGLNAQLINPYNGSNIYLPSVLSIPGVQPMNDTVRRIVLCEPPSSGVGDGDDHKAYLAIALVVTRTCQLLAISQGIDQSWMVLKNKKRWVTYEDVIVHMGMVFAVVKGGDVYAWDLPTSASDGSSEPKLVRRPDIDRNRYILDQFYLAETADGRRLLLACTYGRISTYEMRGSWLYYKEVVEGFQPEGMLLYELDVNNPVCLDGGEEWRLITSLGDGNCALFLGTNYPFWANVVESEGQPREQCIRPNCVCLAPDVNFGNFGHNYDPHDAAVYDLEDQSYTCIHLFFSDRYYTYQVPIWMKPILDKCGWTR